jgi:SpoVK/Ycf46/Vps4 family AAA+-type ATPase
MELTDGLTLTLGATTTGFIVKELVAWVRGRNQRTEIAPDPLNVHTEKKPSYVPVAECNRRMCEHAERMTRLEGEVKESNAAVIKKLDEIDSRAEERAQATHRRLDPMIGQVAANTEAIGNIKQLAFNATMGGKK